MKIYIHTDIEGVAGWVFYASWSSTHNRPMDRQARGLPPPWKPVGRPEPRRQELALSGYASILNMGHCICNFVPSALTLGDLPDLGGLLWPRPVVVEACTTDAIFPIANVREAVKELQRVYNAVGASQTIALDEFEGGHQISGALAYDFLVKELKHRHAGNNPLLAGLPPVRSAKNNH